MSKIEGQNKGDDDKAVITFRFAEDDKNLSGENFEFVKIKEPETKLRESKLTLTDTRYALNDEGRYGLSHLYRSPTSRGTHGTFTDVSKEALIKSMQRRVFDGAEVHIEGKGKIPKGQEMKFIENVAKSNDVELEKLTHSDVDVGCKPVVPSIKM